MSIENLRLWWVKLEQLNNEGLVNAKQLCSINGDSRCYCPMGVAGLAYAESIAIPSALAYDKAGLFCGIPQATIAPNTVKRSKFLPSGVLAWLGIDFLQQEYIMSIYHRCGVKPVIDIIGRMIESQRKAVLAASMEEASL